MKRIPFFSVLMAGLVLTAPALAGDRFAADRTAAEKLPSWEMMGMPITPVQVQVLAAVGIRERSSTPTEILEGIPASPHQAAVLAPRQAIAEAAERAH